MDGMTVMRILKEIIATLGKEAVRKQRSGRPVTMDEKIAALQSTATVPTPPGVDPTGLSASQPLKSPAST